VPGGGTVGINAVRVAHALGAEVDLLDVDLPHVSGIDLCRALRSDPRWAEIPILFATAYTDRETVQRGFRAGADDYITKPINRPELLARVKSLLRIKTLQDEVKAQAAELGRRLGLELPSHLGTAAGGLEQHRTDAERAEEASRAAERELGRIDDGLGRTEDLMDDLEREREELLGLLARFGDGDADAGLEAVAQRQRARDDAERLRLELEREHPDLRDKIERIRRAEEEAENWLTDDAELAAARASLDELGRGIEQMGRTEESLNQRLSHLEERITTDQIDGELEALDAELQEAMRERDRRIVLAEVVRRADRQFRERNDPDVLGRAAQHLSALTHGRYTEIEASEADVSGPLSVEDPDTGRRVGVDHLSTGTREQVYFSLRLAIMDHLDSEGERLPVLVDEAFVNWDPSRRERLLGILDHLARTRQVFVFTCHPEWAEQLTGRGGRLVELGESTGGGAR